MKFLEQYLNNASPTGYEWEGQKIWMDYLKPYADEFITDTYGSAVAVINPEHEYKVVIEGHSDEISWYVNYIHTHILEYGIDSIKKRFSSFYIRCSNKKHNTYKMKNQ